MTSVSTIVNAGVSSLLQSMNSGSASGLFNAIGGTTTTDKTSAKLFGAINHQSSSSTSIDTILQQKKVSTQTNSIYANVASRLDAMQAGTYTASSDWEKVASYAMQTGQPVSISLNSSGQVEAVPQSQADLSKYNVQQQKKLTDAMSQISTMASKIQANQKNQSMINKLAGASYDLEAVWQSAATAQTSTTNNWESTGISLMTIHHPFKISLDSNGDLQVEDQLTSDMSDLSLSQQKTLRAALESIPDVISSGIATTEWQADAQAYDEAGVPYYLEIDPITSQISAKENSADNITPDFLKEDPYPSIGDNTTLLKQAAKFIKAGQAFFLDIDTTGQVVAKQATAQNLIKFNAASTTSTTDSNGVGSILSLFA